MSDAPTPELEKELAGLTAWAGPTPELWRRALKAAGKPAGGRATLFRRIMQYRLTGRFVVGAAAVLLFALIGILMNTGSHPGAGLTSIGTSTRAAPESRERFRKEVAGGVPLIQEKEDSFGAAKYQFSQSSGLDAAGGGRMRAEVAPSERGYDSAGDIVLGAPVMVPGRGLRPGPAPDNTVEFRGERLSDSAGKADTQSSTDRQVIRKATIELVAKDVRGAFLKASHLISEAQSEYVEDSGVTGSAERIEANLTLRVAATRLGQVLTELRELGEVRSEKTSGEDVTTQVVDLEARLRNEQRVETELLQLLEKRQDAPLKEILELRSSIANVRQTIEQLTGQRERLSRLVSLATVLVIIRPPDAPMAQPEPTTGLSAYFVNAIARAWHSGSAFLVDTLAGILSVLLGGLVWWVLLVVVVLVIRSYRRRAGARPPATP